MKKKKQNPTAKPPKLLMENSRLGIFLFFFYWLRLSLHICELKRTTIWGSLGLSVLWKMYVSFQMFGFDKKRKNIIKCPCFLDGAQQKADH